MLTARLVLERFSKDGRLLEKRDRPSRSFLFQFIELLYVAHAQIVDGAPYSMMDITSAARDVDSQTTSGAHYTKGTLRIGAPGGGSETIFSPGNRPTATVDYSLRGHPGDFVGIQAGTGVGVVTPTDVAMGTRIAHGEAAGELEYGGCELVRMTIADPNGQFTIRRYFTNNSGGGITVQEVGIYAGGTKYLAADGYAYIFAIARDLTGGVAVADTELLRATYVVQITV